MNRIVNISIVILGMALVMISSCKKETTRVEPEDPDFENPFEGINDNNGPGQVNIDPESFLGIYNNILSVKCGSDDGACHDGSFEPDYRTLFSAYNSLVYHAPTKNIIESIVGNDTTWVFDHRVSPGDPDASWLHYRVTTNDEELGRMPLYDQALPEEEIDNIRDWILDGAPDPMGNLPIEPTLEPQLYGMMAFENDLGGLRLDTARENIFDPMVFPQNTNINLWFCLIDFDMNGAFLPGASLTGNILRISDHLYNFDASIQLDMSVNDVLNPVMGPVFSAGGNVVPYYQWYNLNTADYETGTIYYMRVTVQGGLQDDLTVFPETGAPIYWQTYLSFVVE